MQTFSLSLGSWWHHLLARNPLVRGSDRIEAVAILLIVVVGILVIPLAGAAGTAVFDERTHAFASDRLTRHQVEATATRDSTASPEAYEKPFLTQIHWRYAGGTHTDEMRTGQLKAGEPLTIWVDAAGNRSAEPLTDEDAAAAAIVAALALWAALVGSATAVWAGLRLRLTRLRYADWDRELDDLAGNGRTNNNA